MEEIRRAATVRGRVQGVSFRWYTSQRAAGLGVTGWVRNEHDGSVRFEAQGPADAVDALLAWARHGPDHARVSSIEVEDRTLVGAETEFRIVG